VKPSRGGLLSSIGAAILLLALPPAASWASYPGANGLIAYQGVGSRGSDSEIFTIPPDGGYATQLTDNLVGDSQPSWSANGRRITFVRSEADTAGVWMMKADGQDQHLVAPIPPDVRGYAQPSFSPGGGRIVMARRHRISTVRTDGSDLRQLVSGAVGQPKYSPNGKRIAFSGLPDGKQRSGIWTVRRDGSHLRRLTPPPEDIDDSDTSPDWRPDGRRIVYAQCRDESEHGGCGDGGIYSIRPDGSERRRVYYWVPQGGSAPPVYSPSGHRLALHHVVPDYYWDINPDACADIFTISAKPASDWSDYLHRHRQPVTHNCEDLQNGGQGGWAFNPSWQPIPPP
jgi:Tol biopolymer transport system component